MFGLSGLYLDESDKLGWRLKFRRGLLCDSVCTGGELCLLICLSIYNNVFGILTRQIFVPGWPFLICVANFLLD